jgi:hypothetical protein
LNENAVLDDRPRARQQKPSLIDAQRQSTSKKLLAFNNQCDDHQHAATPPRHPDCREALIQIVALQNGKNLREGERQQGGDRHPQTEAELGFISADLNAGPVPWAWHLHWHAFRRGAVSP